MDGGAGSSGAPSQPRQHRGRGAGSGSQITRLSSFPEDDSVGDDTGGFSGAPYRALGQNSNMRGEEAQSAWYSALLFCGSQQTHVHLRDKIILTEFGKWKKYRIFPFKFLFHLLLLVAVTGQVAYFTSKSSAYVRAARRNWFYYLFPEDYDLSGDPYYLYDRSEIIRSVSRAARNFDIINASSVDRLAYVPSPLGYCAKGDCGKLTITTYASDSLFDSNVGVFNDTKVTKSYIINGTSLGPFQNETDQKAVLHRLVSMSLDFAVKSYVVGTSEVVCYLWDIVLDYDFKTRGQVALTLQSRLDRNCDDEFKAEYLWYRSLWLDFVIVALAVCYLAMSVKDTAQRAQLLMRTRANERHVSNEVDARVGFKLREQLYFFDLADAIAVLACVCCIGYASHNIAYARGTLPTHEGMKLATGIGCFLLWINLLGHLANSKGYYTLVLTLRRAIPRVFQFLVGVMPVMLAYAFFGVLYFGDVTDRFGSWTNSMITLFAVLNGDVIRESFMDILPFYPLISQLYLYSFVCLFIYVVLNVFIAIVEESFFSTREKARSMQRFFEHLHDEIDGEEDNEADADAEQHENVDVSAMMLGAGNASGGHPSSSPSLRSPRLSVDTWSSVRKALNRLDSIQVSQRKR